MGIRKQKGARMVTEQRRVPYSLTWPHQLQRHRCVGSRSGLKSGRRTIASEFAHGQPHEGSISHFLFVPLSLCQGCLFCSQSFDDVDGPISCLLDSITGDQKMSCCCVLCTGCRANELLIVICRDTEIVATDDCADLPSTFVYFARVTVSKKYRPELRDWSVL